MPPWYLGRPPKRKGNNNERISSASRFFASELPQDNFNAAFFFFLRRVFTTSGLSLSAAKTRQKPHSRHQEDKCARLVFLFFFLNNRHFAIVRDLERIKNNAGCLFSNAGKNKTPRVCFVFAVWEKLQKKLKIKIRWRLHEADSKTSSATGPCGKRQQRPIDLLQNAALMTIWALMK